MSDPPKSIPFSFSPTVTSSGGANGLFGQTSTGGLNVQNSLFGSNKAASSANPDPFSKAPTTSGTSSIFNQGSTSGQPLSTFGGGGAFGGNASGSTDKSSGFNFSPAPTTNTSSGGFSIGQVQPPAGQPSSSGAPSIFSGFSTSNKTMGIPSTAQGQNSGLFGTGSSTGNVGLFGTPNSSSFSSSQAEASTPVSKPGAGFTFPSSTTPIGPPPADTGVGAKSGFVFNTFNSQNTAQPTMQDANTTTASPNVLGGFSALSSSQPQGGTSLFNKAGSLGTNKPATSEAGIFSNLNNSKDSGSLYPAISSPSTSQQTQAPSAKSSSLFPNLGAQSGATSAPQTSSSSFFSGISQNSPMGASKPTGFASFAKLASSQASTAPSTTSALSGTSGVQGASLRMAAPLSNSPSLGNPKDSTAASTDESKNMGQPSGQQPLPTSATKSNLFSGLAQSATSNTAQPSSQTATTGISDSNSNFNPSLGASTTGPTPPAQSRLKNKSMDEIITRWASDLSKYQTEFQRQAEQVSIWDRMLVENSEKIQKLYGSTLEAERATTEVERQLTAVENDQEELSTWLDHYEKEVDRMMSTQVVQGESLQGPDQDRERT